MRMTRREFVAAAGVVGAASLTPGALAEGGTIDPAYPIVIVAPVLMCTSPATTVANPVITGYCRHPTGIMIEAVAGGTVAGDQLPAVFQSVLTWPVHVKSIDPE